MLAFDAEGEIYIIETKLYKNPDKRRVIAQMLDYGAALWETPAQLIAKAEDTGWRTRLLEFLGNDEESVAAHREAIQRNAAAGKFWFVVLMDQLDERLRQLIAFVNTNSRFKVLGVQLDFYRHDDFEIIIPNLYGAEIANEAELSAKPAFQRKVWNEEAFFAASEKKVGPRFAAEMRAFYDRLDSLPEFVVSGTRTAFRVALHNAFPKPIFYVYENGNILLNFGDLSKMGDRPKQYCERLGAALQQVGFLKLSPDYLSRYPSVPVSTWGTRTEQFLALSSASVSDGIQ